MSDDICSYTNLLVYVSVAHRVLLEISLIHKDNKNMSIMCDETHHPFSNKGHKGGSTAARIMTGTFNRLGDPGIASASHVTGVYAIIVAGYPMSAFVRCEFKSKARGAKPAPRFVRASHLCMQRCR